MKSLVDFISESYINEWKQDLMPQCIIVMGGPGAGKTHWMDHAAHKFFKDNNNAQLNIAFKKLDSDNNLKKYQRLHVDEFAEGIIKTCSAYAIHGDDVPSPKAAFKQYIADQQQQMNAACDAVGSKGMYINLDVIEWHFCKTWIDKYDSAKADNKQSILDQFKNAFMSKYFDSLFASDFSVRGMSKAEYKRDFNNKLKGELEGLDFVGQSDVVVAITGDELEKFEQIADICGQTHAITVVYLNVPEELSIRQDAARNRSVGSKLIHQKLQDIHHTWDELLGEFKRIGIYKLVEMVDAENGKGKHPTWTVNKEYINTDLIKSQR
jgi:Cdc6-like AAA superfamily ATPase